MNTPVFDTYQVCPPGFSFAIIPFLKIFGGDENKAVLAYDIVVAILFVYAVRLLGKRAGLSPTFNNIITLIAGCFQYIFFMAWSTTDAICVCLTLFAVTETVGIINKKENISLLRVIRAGLLFSLPFFFRYMYLPIALLLPFLILLSGFLLKNKNLKIGGVKILGASAFFLIVLFVFNLSISGNALHVTGVERGFFIDQFTDCYPFLPASFINIDFGAQLIQSVFGLDYSRVIFYLQIINPVILVFLIFLLCRILIRQKKDLQYLKSFTFYYYWLSCIALLLFSCLRTLPLPIKNYHGAITGGHLLVKTGISLLSMCLSRYCFSFHSITIDHSLRSQSCGFLLSLHYAAWE